MMTPNSSAVDCLETPQDCRDSCKDYFLCTFAQSGDQENFASYKNWKCYTTITRHFILPYDQAIHLYQHAMELVSSLSQSNARAFWWKCTYMQQQVPSVMEQVSHVTHLAEQGKSNPCHFFRKEGYLQ